MRARVSGLPVEARFCALAISGSLRSQSTNRAILEALKSLAPAGFEVVLYDQLSQIPPFNPDLEDNGPDSAVNLLRSAIRESDVVVFSTPEYAHGIPGSLKNALDWIVGTGELSRKPVVLLNASSRGTYAQAALREVVKTMDARVLTEAELTLDLPRGSTPAEIVQEPLFASALTGFLQKLIQLVNVPI